MSEQPNAHSPSPNTSQAVTIVFTAAVFLVAGLLIAMILNSGDGVSQDELRDSVDNAVGTRVAASGASNAMDPSQIQALVDQSVATQVAAMAPITLDTGDSGNVSQAQLQALVDQAVGTQVAALQPTNTPIPPTPTTIPILTTSDDDAFRGPENAPVVIVEFSDFQCGYCRRWALEVLPRILEEYPDDVKFVYRDFTIFGEDSIRAAMATECAEEQGRFWEMHDSIFAILEAQTPDALSEDSLVSAAGDMGLDTDSFRECLASERYLSEIVNDYRAAEEWGFRGTPAFIINGVVYPFGAQAFEVFDGIIRQEIAAAAG